MIPVSLLVSFPNIQNEHAGEFLKRNSGINLRAQLLSPSIISLADMKMQKWTLCLPLSGFSGLGCLDGASVLDDVPLLRGRSISNREWEDHGFLSHRDNLLVHPLLAQVLLGIIKALHRLQRGNRIVVIFLAKGDSNDTLKEDRWESACDGTYFAFL